MSDEVAGASDDQVPLSTQLLQTLASRTGRDVREFETPLHEVVDPDALNRLFAHRENSPDARVVFHYADCRVTVFADRSFDVEPLD